MWAAEVLKGIDLKIKEGEPVVLFGPNGSGKTTLLMTLMGFSGYEVTHRQLDWSPVKRLRSLTGGNVDFREFGNHGR